ncbi:ABC transporter ATP-binding protein [Amycolatopsis sp. YIM 10]|uniref:ABC transporter ATP-binding protein n=1 Tax=Amycolatopsis sp. YIM 10 TaxID=2653857 RepID=UPI00129011AC|nr:ATP-binding cassette domain-containing protein [Amycolatopsis sp. YIM 10]QFU89810.1 High-affinity branched-chain amino acid transport ATP-binding protein LivF [Amycolatopsis sp. YIM 10]
MLTLHALDGGYGQAAVVREASTEIGDGEIVALLGRNGMGKTTLLRTIFGLAVRQGGEITLDGHPVPPNRPDLLARWGASLMPEDRGVFGSLTVEENLALAARKSFTPAVDPREVFPLLTDRRRQLAGTLSGGQKQQLGIARALLAGRRVVVVDELTQGLQPSVVRDVVEALGRVAATGVSVLVVDQHPDQTLAWCHRVLVMASGRLVLDAPSAADTRRRCHELLMLR